MDEAYIVRDLRRKRLISLKGLQSLSFSSSPMASLLPFDRFPLQGNPFNSEKPENQLEKILRQRMESVERVWPIIQSRLGEVGIQVTSNDEPQNTQGSAFLWVNISLGKPKKKATCSVNLSLMQEVILDRDPEIRFHVQTWESGEYKRKYPTKGKLYKEHDGLIGGLEDAVEEAIRRFIDDYRIANDLE